jgi:hypothetical protein
MGLSGQGGSSLTGQPSTTVMPLMPAPLVGPSSPAWVGVGCTLSASTGVGDGGGDDSAARVIERSADGRDVGFAHPAAPNAAKKTHTATNDLLAMTL